MQAKNKLEPEAIEAFEPEAKVGLIATVSEEGLPHISLISSIRAKGPDRIMWGQFSEGRSKVNVRKNNKTGFLVLTMDKRMWRGKAQWTHTETQGEDFEEYNNTPMFRYNAYFGIHTVHYMDLVETYGRENLPMAKIVVSSIATKMAKGKAGAGGSKEIMKPWAMGLFNNLGALKFLSYVGEDGFPKIIPLIQCQAPDSTCLAFSPGAFGNELSALEKGISVAVFGLTMKMEDVLVRGVFSGFERYRSVRLGRVDLDWVYNSMPPQQGQIYPPVELKAVENFQL